MKRFGRWLCALAFLGCGAAAMAQAPYPSKVVTMMVPYPAGAASDFTARALNDLVGKELGGQVIVENIGGATGAIAAAKVLAAPADGHYLFQGSPNELILSGLVNKSTRYKPEDFQWIAPVATSPLVLVVNSQLPAHSLDEFVALARSRKDAPLSYGTPGPGTLYHLLGELFTRRTGAPVTHVPYKGGAPIIQDLIGGQIDFAFMPYQAFYADYVKQGRLRVIGSLSPGRRLPAPFDTLQSSAQSKDMKDFDFGIWTSYMVRKGTPRPVAERLNAAIAAALKNPQARAQLESQAKTVFEPMSLEAGEKFYAAEIARYRDLVKTIGYESP
ncbi:Tripartite-type tricarboxylate transporter, receptor component TctC [Variovorax sp. YR750]|uniref:Bug family tripartite tricarboxylate transporter substrate binding protein n=1 Tax=Variovorax sp. YR750 TaxID=1884384 RepID=UPI0008C32B22|nr:tripartite tricarboxylate transporter substrate binding protein [Variovorax sp. YR750]SEM40109.1 Tripartite-type tricarboxylate transporter, receptor component TctC [Variovorax sp. YR750]